MIANEEALNFVFTLDYDINHVPTLVSSPNNNLIYEIKESPVTIVDDENPSVDGTYKCHLFLSPVKHLFVAGSFLPCLGLMRKHYLGLSEISLAIFFLFELDPFLDVTLLTKSSLLINQKSFSDLEALLGDVI
ncbi:hypothetical protein V6N12_013014 [Hibiscus sabdariffa]|uniref:Uncharacterized protein n=1 Tax=Hibiscus sabdariffa TaxID=183260 RepID=A0ABR2EG45_9ROSI